MSDPVSLTPATLESLLADAGHETFVAFVAGLLEREGRNVRRDGSVITVDRPDGGHERLLVWTDERGPVGRLLGTETPTFDGESVDAIVALERDAAGAGAVAASRGARVIDTDELHDRLLYAIDRESCVELCRRHLGTAVEPRADDRSARKRSPFAAALQPRVLLAGVAVLGVVVAVAAGLPASPGGNGLGATPTVATPGSGGTNPVTPVGGGAPRDTGSPPATDTATPDSQPWSVARCEGCLPLLSLPELRVAAGSRKTVTTTVHNPHPSPATGVDVRLVQPSTEVRIDPERGRALGTLEPNETRAVTWELSATDAASGTYDVIVVIRFRNDSRTTYGRDVVPLTVTRSTPALPEECGGSCDLLGADRTVRAPADGTTAVTATIRNPYSTTITDIAVTAEPPAADWSVTPANATRIDALPPDASRELRWNLTVPASAAGEYSFAVRATFTGPSGIAGRTVTLDYSVYVVPPTTASAEIRQARGIDPETRENS